MKFKLDFDVPEGVLQLTHHDSMILLGSCFAEEMTVHLRKSGFRELANPFGVIFHPLALAGVLSSAMHGSEQVSTCHRDDLWLSWEASSQCFAYLEEDLKRLLLQRRTHLREALDKASVLVITFGTAWGYTYQDTGKMVANCHKFPREKFRKELSETGEMVRVWTSLLEEMKERYPRLKIVMSVSPVRHTKDGLVENTRSKARLIEVVHACCSLENAVYFPAYEIVMDELRDYRFFADDLVHPSPQAVEYVWERFARFCFTEDAYALGKEVEHLHRAMSHRSLHPDSVADKQRKKQLEERRESLRNKHPEILLFPNKERD